MKIYARDWRSSRLDCSIPEWAFQVGALHCTESLDSRNGYSVPSDSVQRAPRNREYYTKLGITYCRSASRDTSIPFESDRVEMVRLESMNWVFSRARVKKSSVPGPAQEDYCLGRVKSGRLEAEVSESTRKSSARQIMSRVYRRGRIKNDFCRVRFG